MGDCLMMRRSKSCTRSCETKVEDDCAGGDGSRSGAVSRLWASRQKWLDSQSTNLSWEASAPRLLFGLRAAIHLPASTLVPTSRRLRVIIEPMAAGLSACGEGGEDYARSRMVWCHTRHPVPLTFPFQDARRQQRLSRDININSREPY